MKTYENVGDVQQTTKTTWKWTINNYSNYVTSNRTEVLSPNFSVIQSDNITNWRFEVYPNGENEKNKHFLSVFLKNLDEDDVTAVLEFSVLSQTNENIYSNPPFPEKVFSKKVEPNNDTSKIWGRPQFVSHEFLNDEAKNALTNNILVLQCRIVINQELNVMKKTDDLLKNDFENLLDSEKYTDLTLVVGRKRMRLHKAILASRSPVFKAMFEHDMKENQQNTVKITDTKLKIMKEMCRYMYAGKVNEIDSIAKDLLIAADKYSIEGLKTLCEKTICDQINIDNALVNLELANDYSAKFLKSKVYEFVTKNIKDIYQKPQFKELDAEIKDEIMGIIIGVKSVKL